MTAIARITVEQALLVNLLAAFSLFLSWMLFRTRPHSRYPSVAASLVCFFIALWLFDNVFTDRSAVPTLVVIFGRLSWVIPYFVFLALLSFGLNFPPRSTKKMRLAGYIFATAIAVVGTFITMHPAGLVVDFSEELRFLKTNSDHTYYYIVMTSFVSLIGMILAIFSSKWKRISAKDRRPLYIFLGSFLVMAFLTIAFSVLESYNESSNYYYVYSSFSTALFSFGFTYAILKYGAFEQGVAFSRTAIMAFVLAIITLGVLIIVA